MSRPGILCNINLKDAINEVFRIGDDFIDAPELKNKISDPSGFVKEVYTQTFRIPWKFRDDISYNKGELKIKFNKKVYI